MAERVTVEPDGTIISTSDDYYGEPVEVSFTGHVDVKRVAAQCVNVQLDHWTLQITSAAPIKIEALCDDGRRMP